ncbi:MAG TPA: serine hydrolase domain-containing protein [Puia sp.]|nr:serine hydrolase domain-containing protein [Puia sp.]
MKNLFRSLVACCAFLFFCSTGTYLHAQMPQDLLTSSSDPGTQARIKEIESDLPGWVLIEGYPKRSLAERMAYYKIHGLSIAVVHDYKIVWAKTYGWADSAEKKPLTVKTLFQAASISKSLNAVGMLRLAQHHKVDLYTDINQYLVHWKFPYDSVSKNKKITIANLLSHTAGLTVHGFGGYAKGDTLPTLEQVLDGKKPANSPPVRSQFEPGLRFMYSGGGTTISQQIIMDVTGMAYDRYMWENVLKPLGMINSFYTQPPPANRQADLASAYEEDGSLVKGNYHTYPEEAAAGLWTNPTDLCKYIIETQLALQGKSSKVLSQEFTQLRLTPYVDQSAAFGVFIDKRGNEKYFQHGGANEGFRSQYFGSMDHGDGVAVMVNSDDGRIMPELINSVARAYDWKDFYKPETKKLMKLTTAQLKAVEGKYQFEFQKGKPAYIQITSNSNNGIVLKQLWDGQEISFLPESELEFFCPTNPFPLKFTKDQTGQITQVLAFNRDLWNRVKE